VCKYKYDMERASPTARTLSAKLLANVEERPGTAPSALGGD